MRPATAAAPAFALTFALAAILTAIMAAGAAPLRAEAQVPAETEAETETGAGAGLAAAADRPDVDWLIYDRMAEGYAVDRFAADPARHEITPIWSDAPPGDWDHVLLLIPKKSVDAYSVSVGSILSTFRERRRPARFSVWLTGNREDIGREALGWAEASGVDLIMPVGSDATIFIHGAYSGGAIPVVTSASKDPVLMGQIESYETGSGGNIAYTSINVRVETLVSKLREVFADLETIYVLYSTTNASAIQTQLRPLEAFARDPARNLTIGEVPIGGGGSAREDLRVRITAAMEEIRARDPEGRRSIFWITGSTSVYAHIGLIDELAQGVPVLAALPDVVRPGRDSAVLSIGVNQSSAVHVAALYAIRVLEGSVEAGALPVGQVSPPDIAINFLKVEEMGLTLPFTFFEDATFIYDRAGRTARAFGQRVALE